MPWSNPDFISRADVGMAYREAKADIFYERGHPYTLSPCHCEEESEQNLSCLHERLTSGEPDWMTIPQSVGGWSAIPKSFDLERVSAAQRAGAPPTPVISGWQRTIRANDHARNSVSLGCPASIPT